MKQKKRVEILNFDANSTLSSFYNYYPKKTLNNCHGIKSAMFPLSETSVIQDELLIQDAGIERVDGITYFKQHFSETSAHRLLVYASDKKLYINQLFREMYDLIWLYNLEFDTVPITLNFKKDDADAIILADTSKMVVWKTDHSPYTIKNVPIITSMCFAENTLFCTIRHPASRIWYTANIDPEIVGETTNNSNYITLDDNLGDARKIMSFNEEVYVFRDYGISKINYVKGEISVSQIYMSNTLIYANTISICGNFILFVSKDGIYSFNGVKVTKTSVDLSNLLSFDNSKACAESLANKYYLSLNLNFDDNKKIICEKGEYVNNALLIIDTNDFSYEIIRGVDIKSLVPIKNQVFEKMLVTFNTGNINKIGEICSGSSSFDENLPHFYSSDYLTEDLDKKMLTCLTVYSNYGVKFKIIYDDNEKVFTATKNGLNKFRFKLCCEKMKVEILSDEKNAQVQKMFLDYYVY